MANNEATRPLTAEALGRIAYEANRDLFDDPIPWARLDDDERPLFRNEAAAFAAAVLGAARKAVVNTQGWYSLRQKQVSVDAVLAALDALAREVAGE